ncbi:MAG: hypothetical protein ACJZ2B_00145 [Candidatus Neomarinimicrobiota bacterium]|tara:strand:+ start:3681 stop:4181 length:501 start_codon:yes stop_codon:yes gene_type:complete
MKISIKITICLIPFLLNAQQYTSRPNKQSDDQKRWEDLRYKVETAVIKGDISRDDANKRYARFRARVSGQRVELKDPVLEGYFKRYGIEDIDNLKNRILDQGIPADQLDAVLGGMLRLAHSIKLDGINYKINPRFQVYFEERLGMTKSQIIKIEKIAKDIVSEHID